MNDFLLVHINNLGDFRFNFSGKCVVINDGKEIEVPNSFFVSRDFVEGYAPVCMGEKWGVVNSSFNIIIKPQYDNIQSLGNRIFKISHKKGLVDWEHGLCRIAKGELLNPKYNVVEKISSTLFLFGEKSRFERQYDKYGVIDINGNIILSQDYFDIKFKEGFFFIKEYRTGYANSSFQSSHKETFIYILADSEGKIVVETHHPIVRTIGKNWAIINYQSLFGIVNLHHYCPVKVD